MPKSGSYKLSVFPRDDQPYIMTKVTVGDTQGLAPIETEIKLMRGVLVRFRLIDKETGQRSWAWRATSRTTTTPSSRTTS